MNEYNDKRPRVGVGVMVIKDDQVLLHKRKNAHGDGTWSFPGGHLEFKESWEECTRREVAEETGLDIVNLRFAMATNDIFDQENKHYITIFMLADYVTGEAQVMEPDKCERWEWFAWDDLPEPLFIPVHNLLKQGFDLANIQEKTNDRVLEK